MRQLFIQRIEVIPVFSFYIEDIGPEKVPHAKSTALVSV